VVPIKLANSTRRGEFPCITPPDPSGPARYFSTKARSIT
jgi:hypothetical protein